MLLPTMGLLLPLLVVAEVAILAVAPTLTVVLVILITVVGFIMLIISSLLLQTGRINSLVFWKAIKTTPVTYFVISY